MLESRHRYSNKCSCLLYVTNIILHIYFTPIFDDVENEVNTDMCEPNLHQEFMLEGPAIRLIPKLKCKYDPSNLIQMPANKAFFG